MDNPRPSSALDEAGAGIESGENMLREVQIGIESMMNQLTN